MTDDSTPTVSKGRTLLVSAATAACASVGYVVVALLNQTDPLWLAIGVVGITAALTPIFYFTSLRRSRTR